MMSISSPQYVWTLFTKSFQDGLGATLADDPDHLLDPDRAANLAVAAARLSGRQIRPAAPDRRRRLLSGARLGHVGLCHEPDGPLSDLWPVLRRRHRHRLYRHHRADGALVSRPARLRHRHGRGRLWLRRDPDHLPDRHDARRAPATSTRWSCSASFSASIGAAAALGLRMPRPATCCRRRVDDRRDAAMSRRRRDAEDARCSG